MAQDSSFNHVIYDVATGVVLFTETDMWVTQNVRKNMTGTAHAILPFAAFNGKVFPKIDGQGKVVETPTGERTQEIITRKETAELRRQTYSDIRRSLTAVLARRIPHSPVEGGGRLVDRIIAGQGVMSLSAYATAIGKTTEQIIAGQQQAKAAREAVNTWVMIRMQVASDMARDITTIAGREACLNYLRTEIGAMPSNAEILQSYQTP